MKKYAQICTTLIALLALLGISSASIVTAQPTTNQAGLALQFPDGSTQTYCIPFTGDSISGLDMLLKTGLEVKVEAYGGLGALVCKIGASGCDYPEQPCACQSFGPGGVYWSYHHLKDGQWKTSIVGAGSYKVHNGDVEGWAWSDGKPPALYTFAQLCPAAQPEVHPTNTSTPQPSAIPPSHTPQPAVPPTHTATVSPPTHKPTAIATVTSIPTPRRPTPTTRTIQPTSTHSPKLSTATVVPTHPPTPTPTLQPTATPTQHPTSTATNTALPTPTTQSTTQPTVAPAQPTQIAPTLTQQPQPTHNPQPTTRNPEDAARIAGIAIGGVVIVSLALWGIVAAIRGKRKEQGRSHDVE